MLSEWFQKEGVGARFPRAAGRGQDAKNHDESIARCGVGFDPAAQRQPVEHRDEDFGNDDVRDDLASLLERTRSVLLEHDRVASLTQEMSLELANVRIAIDDQYDRFARPTQLL